MNQALQTAIELATLGSMGLTAWHHVGWPLLLKTVARPATPNPPASACATLPTITVVVPAYNEEAHIAAKLRNLAAQEYPTDRLKVIVACDGCTDATVAVARAALAEPGCAELRATIVDYARNRGKVAVLNGAITTSRSEIIALTDVTALLPADALLRAAAHFSDLRLGAVGGTYRLQRAGSVGEAKYWRHQIAVKQGEAALGAPLGLHGAFYAFRRSAWQPLRADTINDDFILPMEIFGRGFRVAYDPTIVAEEAEITTAQMDQSRRRRIAAGNMQQLIRLAWLLHPRHGGVALAFASGKALRVLAPFLILIGLLGSVILAAHSTMFALLAALQIAGLIGAAAAGLIGDGAPRALAFARYALAGHLASAAGVVSYLAGRRRAPWQRSFAS